MSLNRTTTTMPSRAPRHATSPVSSADMTSYLLASANLDSYADAVRAMSKSRTLSNRRNAQRSLSGHNSMSRKLTAPLSHSPTHPSPAGVMSMSLSMSRAGTSYAAPFYYTSQEYRSISDNQYPHQLEQARYDAFDTEIVPRHHALFVYGDEPIAYPNDSFMTVDDYAADYANELDRLVTEERFFDPVYTLPTTINEDAQCLYTSNRGMFEPVPMRERALEPRGVFHVADKRTQLHNGRSVLPEGGNAAPLGAPVRKEGKLQKPGRGTFDCLSPYLMSGKSGVQVKDLELRANRDWSADSPASQCGKTAPVSDSQSPTRAPEQLHTWMLRNLPCKLRQEELVEILNQSELRNKFNFFFTPVDSRKHNNAKKNGKKKSKDTANNKGYAFINLKNKEDSDLLWSVCEDKMFWAGFTTTNSPKKAYLSPATTQGLLANIKFYKNQLLQARELAKTSGEEAPVAQQAPWFKYSEQAFGSAEEFVLWAAGETNVVL